MEKLIVIANLGRVRALKFREPGLDPQEQAHLDEESGSPFEVRPETISDVVTDQAGRFTQSGPATGVAGMSYGEEHELEAQLENRALQRVATRIGEFVASAGFPPWRLMATQEILPRLQEALPAGARDVLARTGTGDLTKVPLADLEKRLLSAS